mmetsp:Transcript_18801/g.27803  ORF Transcript_18801/g.27803 Transcript_18801/m.27803 type:complete len:158 (+) Transcript_18801:1-474(+)
MPHKKRNPHVERIFTMNKATNTDYAFEEAPREDKARRREVGGAAVAGGLLGLTLAGPMVGVVAGAGAAALTTTKGGAGKIARASGDAVCSGGERLKQWNRKHQVTAKTNKALRSAGGSFKRWDEKHGLTKKTSSAIVTGCNKISKTLKPQPVQEVRQ